MEPGARPVISINFHAPREQAKAGVFDPGVHEELANSIAYDVQSMISARERAESFTSSLQNQKIQHVSKNSKPPNLTSGIRRVTMPPLRYGFSAVPEYPVGDDVGIAGGSRTSVVQRNPTASSANGAGATASVSATAPSLRSSSSVLSGITLSSSPSFSLPTSPMIPLEPVRTLARPSLTSLPQSARSAYYPYPHQQFDPQRPDQRLPPCAGIGGDLRRRSVAFPMYQPRLSYCGDHGLSRATVVDGAATSSKSPSDESARSLKSGSGSEDGDGEEDNEAKTKTNGKTEESIVSEIQALEQKLNAKKDLLEQVEHRRQSERFYCHRYPRAVGRARFSTETWDAGMVSSPRHSSVAPSPRHDDTATASPRISPCTPLPSCRLPLYQYNYNRHTASRQSLRSLPMTPRSGHLPSSSRRSCAYAEQCPVTPQTPCDTPRKLAMYHRDSLHDGGGYTPSNAPQTPSMRPNAFHEDGRYTPRDSPLISGMYFDDAFHQDDGRYTPQGTPRTPGRYQQDSFCEDSGRYTPSQTPRASGMYHGTPSQTPRNLAMTPRQYHRPMRERALTEQGPLMLAISSSRASLHSMPLHSPDITPRHVDITRGTPNNSTAPALNDGRGAVPLRPMEVVPTPQQTQRPMRTGPYLVHTPFMKSPAIGNLISTNHRLKYTHQRNSNFGPLMKSISSNVGLNGIPTYAPHGTSLGAQRPMPNASGLGATTAAPQEQANVAAQATETARPSVPTSVPTGGTAVPPPTSHTRPLASPQLSFTRLQNSTGNASWKLPQLAARSQPTDAAPTIATAVPQLDMRQTAGAKALQKSLNQRFGIVPTRLPTQSPARQQIPVSPTATGERHLPSLTAAEQTPISPNETRKPPSQSGETPYHQLGPHSLPEVTQSQPACSGVNNTGVISREPLAVPSSFKVQLVPLRGDTQSPDLDALTPRLVDSIGGASPAVSVEPNDDGAAPLNAGMEAAGDSAPRKSTGGRDGFHESKESLAFAPEIDDDFISVCSDTEETFGDGIRWRGVQSMATKDLG
eukprot:GEMP01003991.1.p1 GENE.GEMP01003991.1~~GEMP01003991.1.p1  ORF type:complete len:1026 (-),score=192.43 GEMP01003991.1:1209-4286(-)